VANGVSAGPAIGSRRRLRGFRPLGLSRDNTFLALSTLLLGASFGFYQYVLPLFISSLGASPDQVGLALAIGNSGGIVSILVGGVFVDRFSYRWQMIVSWVLTAIGGGLFVVAGSWEVVALGLLLATLSLFAIPAMNAYIVLARDGQDTTPALTNVYVGFTVGMAITPALGGWIIAQSGMTAMFLASFLCVVASTVAVCVVRERPASSVARPATVGQLAPGVRLIVAPLRTYAAPLRNAPLRTLLLVLVALYVSTYTGISLLPNYLQDRLGIASSTVGVFGSGAAVVAVVASLTLARFSTSLGTYRAMAVAQLMLVAGFALILGAPGLGGAAFVASGIGFSLRGGIQAQQALARGMVAAVAEEATIGPAFALQSTVFNAAMALGPALAGVFYALDPSLPAILALIVGVPFGVWLGTRPRRT
jgi:predicted MFS family arabinose efflux permease